MRKLVLIGSIVLLAVVFATGCTATGGSVFDLAVGDCFNDAGLSDTDGEVSSLPVVDCAAGHDNEVFAEFDLPDGPFPGADAADELALEGCLGAFDAFVGEPYATSIFDSSFLRPTMDSWDAGDRTVTCFLFPTDNSKMLGSQRNAGM